ncbi:hypothetical protein HDU98_006699 [Podochytrium sp. JEL0797]|nr:hypothetical protein HDU98_006699 [Podochytrium sp. JEL0797]
MVSSSSEQLSFIVAFVIAYRGAFKDAGDIHRNVQVFEIFNYSWQLSFFVAFLVTLRGRVQQLQASFELVICSKQLCFVFDFDLWNSYSHTIFHRRNYYIVVVSNKFLDNLFDYDLCAKKLSLLVAFLVSDGDTIQFWGFFLAITDISGTQQLEQALEFYSKQLSVFITLFTAPSRILEFSSCLVEFSVRVELLYKTGF